MSDLYIIPCCKSKSTSSGNKDTLYSDTAKFLSDDSFNLLMESRSKCYKSYKNREKPLSFGKDFGGCEKGEYLVAYERYCGNLYNVDGLKNLFANRNNNILILSALYGLLSPFDCIQNYELKMDNSYKIWRCCIDILLIDYINENKITKIHLFLGKSTYYYKILNKFIAKACQFDSIDTILLYRSLEKSSGNITRSWGKTLYNKLSGAIKYYDSAVEVDAIYKKHEG